MIATLRPRDAVATDTLALRLAVLLAFLAAGGYGLLAAGVLGTGGYQPEPGGEGIVVAAAAGYALGGLLLPLRRRWLWIVGAVINALVMLMFFTAYAGDPSVLLSGGGLATKGAQLPLEVALLFLILRRR
jgi:hypothetical protein